MPPLDTHFREQFDSDSEDNDSNSDSEGTQDNIVDPMEEESMMSRGFLTGLNNICTESNEDNYYAGEENDNKQTNSNSNPTKQKKKGKKLIKVSQKKSKSPYINNPAIKCQNNKKKKRKKVKPTTSTSKTSVSKK